MPVLGNSLYGNGLGFNDLGSLFGDVAKSSFPWLGLIDSGIGLLSGLFNNQRDKALQERLFQRDDTTLDRTMEMYRRNGVNPLLAVPGSTATNTKGFETSPLQSNFNLVHQQKLADERMRLENGIMREELNLKREDLKIRRAEANSSIGLRSAQILNENAKYHGAVRYGQLHDLFGDKEPFYPVNDGTPWYAKLLEDIVMSYVNKNKSNSDNAAAGTSSSLERKVSNPTKEAADKASYDAVTRYFKKRKTSAGIPYVDDKGHNSYFQVKPVKGKNEYLVQFDFDGWRTVSSWQDLQDLARERGYTIPDVYVAYQ